MEKYLHRDKFLQLLKRYSQSFPDELKTSQRFIEFVEQNPDCFSRELSIGHVTGSAWVVSADGREVILTHHKKLNKWIQLGGHCDGDSDVLQVALREAEEESGIENLQAVSSDIFDLDVHLVPEFKNVAAHFHFDTRFVFCATNDQPLKISEESHDLAWVHIERISELSSDESLLRMARKWSKLERGT